jgi:hypothetical protein
MTSFQLPKWQHDVGDWAHYNLDTGGDLHAIGRKARIWEKNNSLLCPDQLASKVISSCLQQELWARHIHVEEHKTRPE